MLENTEFEKQVPGTYKRISYISVQFLIGQRDNNFSKKLNYCTQRVAALPAYEALWRTSIVFHGVWMTPVSKQALRYMFFDLELRTWSIWLFHNYVKVWFALYWAKELSRSLSSGLSKDLRCFSYIFKLDLNIILIPTSRSKRDCYWQQFLWSMC